MSTPASALVTGPPESPTVRLGGIWSLREAGPRWPTVAPRLAGAVRVTVAVETDFQWDSSAATFLASLLRHCQGLGIDVDTSGLPSGLARLVALAFAVPARAPAPEPPRGGYVESVGAAALALWRDFPAMVEFAGEVVLSLGRLLRGKARFRRSDLWYLIEDAGVRALPVVSLISFLVGTILAYMGAIQLALFGAEIYIADLVGVGVVREVAALMTGIILAGRTGASYAAQLGTMQVNEEIDAFRTLGVSPIDYLVLPRVVALVTMVPLLTLYAGMVGILAGALVATTVFNVGPYEYFNQTLSALTLAHVQVGLFKGTVYGALVAFAGCLRGMQCGRSAQAVGEATTRAVVLGIVLITVFACVITVVFQKLDI